MKVNKFLILFLLIANFIFANENELKKYIENGNNEYKNQNYELALENYLKVLHKGYTSSELYYNIGNAYYRLGKIGYAILNYEKALKLSPGDEDTQHNLKVANAHTIDRLQIIPKLFLIEWWDSLLMLFTFNGWAFIFILFFISFLTLIAFYYYYKNSNYQKTIFFAGLVNIVFLTLALIILIVRYNYETTTEYGVLLESNANVKVAPDFDANDAFIIHEGIKFKIEDKVENWTKIKLTDGKVGWLNNKSFKPI